MSRERLTDFVPGLLDRIASRVEALASGRSTPEEQSADEQHARNRLLDQYSLEDMVEELAMLRGAIVELWRGKDEHWVLDLAIDRSILSSILEFTTVRDREREAARVALEKSEARLRCLANAGALLSSTLDLQPTLDHVAQMVVPEFADWCAVDLVREDGTLGDYAAAAHTNPARVELVRDLRRRFPAFGVQLVLATEETQLVEEVDRAWLEAHVENEQQRQMIECLGLCSFVVVPLKSREITFGAIILANTESGRRFSADDYAFTEELARRAASAIDNARLFGETRRAVEVRDRILAVVSHDLRNPLSAIDLASQLLLENQTVRSSPIARKQAETIHRSAARMDRLIADLLDMSAIQTGRLSLEKKKCRIESLVNEVADAHERSALEKGISLVRDIELSGVVLHCDQDRIMQVLSNLLGKSVEFCGRGDRIDISARKADGEVLLNITDTGPGIPGEELSRVFELYWQGKAKEHRSTGLGLFISRGIVEAHGGKLWVESGVGRGSSFFIALPVAE